MHLTMLLMSLEIQIGSTEGHGPSSLIIGGVCHNMYSGYIQNGNAIGLAALSHWSFSFASTDTSFLKGVHCCSLRLIRFLVH